MDISNPIGLSALTEDQYSGQFFAYGPKAHHTLTSKWVVIKESKKKETYL